MEAFLELNKAINVIIYGIAIVALFLAIGGLIIRVRSR